MIEFKGKTKKEMIEFSSKFFPLDVISPISLATSSFFKNYMLFKNAENEKNELFSSFGLVENTQKNKYGLCLGYIVKNHTKEQFYKYKSFFGKELSREMACQRDIKPFNIKEPILLSDDDIRKHIQIVGTTGSGKTMLILSLMKQQIARGGGGIVVFGKGDNDMIQSLYGTALEHNRQNDFYLFDFINGNSELLRDEGFALTNNSLNLFDVGDMLSIINLLKDIAKITAKGDSWEQGAGDYLDALVRVLYILEKANLLFAVNKIDVILQAEDTLAEIKKYHQSINGYMLNKYLVDYKMVIKLTAVLQKMYEEEGVNLNNILYKNVNFSEDIFKTEDKLVLDERDMLDRYLRDMLMSQISNQVNLNELLDAIISEQDAGLSKITSKIRSTQGAFYKLSIASSRAKAVGTFLEKYELILKNEESDINIVEAVRSGKIIVFNIPGQEPQDAETISKLIISILKLLIKKQSRVLKDDDTFLIVLDEINSWAKGGKDAVVGIGDILSVIRGLSMGAIVAHQSDLNSMDGGAGIEKSQVQANVGTTIVLQNSDVSIAESVNKKLKKTTVYLEKETVRVNNKKEDKKDIDYETRERDALPYEVLNSLNTGQGYIIRRGSFEKMISFYTKTLKYSKNTQEYIPINKCVSEKTVKKFVDTFL